MIPKLISAVLSAAILSAVLGSLPCEADGLGQHKTKPHKPAVNPASSAATDLNSPSTSFSDVQPVLEDPRADLIAPKRDKNAFFNRND